MTPINLDNQQANLDIHKNKAWRNGFIAGVLLTTSCFLIIGIVALIV